MCVRVACQMSDITKYCSLPTSANCGLGAGLCPICPPLLKKSSGLAFLYMTSVTCSVPSCPTVSRSTFCGTMRVWAPSSSFFSSCAIIEPSGDVTANEWGGRVPFLQNTKNTYSFVVALVSILMTYNDPFIENPALVNGERFFLNSWGTRHVMRTSSIPSLEIVSSSKKKYKLSVSRPPR